MSKVTSPSIPCPIPYQGSKRKLARRILAFIPMIEGVLIEPFAGSASISLAAASADKAKRFLLCDILRPLMAIWDLILHNPQRLAKEYERLWAAQLEDPVGTYYRVRDQFNRTQEPSKQLYLIVRCVKNAVRFNPRGDFNQSPDHRRLGMRPAKMRREIFAAHRLLSDRTVVLAADYGRALKLATERDLVYMDPPYQGVSLGRDRRYVQPLDLARFIGELEHLSKRRVPFLISFDGRCGSRAYGEDLPARLGLKRIMLEAGRSSQATLLGRDEVTIESLYLSPMLQERLAGAAERRLFQKSVQISLSV